MTSPSWPVLRRRLLWVMVLRAATVTVLLGAATLARMKAPPASPADPFFAVLALTYGLTAVYAVVLPFTARRRWLVDLQLVGDVVLASAVIVVTGGIRSDLLSIYVLPVLAAAILQGRRGGLRVASLAAALFGLVLALQYGGWLEAFAAGAGGTTADLPPAGQAWFTGLYNGSGFLAVALLTGYVAEDLEQTGARLEDASSRIANLQALSEHVIDSLTGGLATTDAAGTILSFNRAAQAITGLAADGARGRALSEVLQLPGEFATALSRIVHEGRGHRVEFVFAREDGTPRDLGVTIAPLVTGTGQAGYVATFQDLTDAKRREREGQLQKRLAAIGEMAAGIAHEIRNPLASISGSIQLLRRELPLSAEQAQLMDIVLRESERLDDTIRSFLAYARPRKQPPSRIELGRLLDDTASLLRHGPGCTTRHRIVVQRPDGDVHYVADEAQMRQVVWNLAINGIRAMPDGGCLTLIVQRTGAWPEPGGVVLGVSDEGVGIAPEARDHLFQPFSSAFPQGTGLGLAIVHRVVTDAGGRIEVDSRPGAGTLVRVHLPAQPAAMETGAGSTGEAAPTPAGAPA